MDVLSNGFASRLKIGRGADAAQDGDLRIIDESGEDYLYAADRLIAIDLPKALARAMLRKAS